MGRKDDIFRTYTHNYSFDVEEYYCYNYGQYQTYTTRGEGSKVVSNRTKYVDGVLVWNEHTSQYDGSESAKGMQGDREASAEASLSFFFRNFAKESSVRDGNYITVDEYGRSEVHYYVDDAQGPSYADMIYEDFYCSHEDCYYCYDYRNDNFVYSANYIGSPTLTTVEQTFVTAPGPIGSGPGKVLEMPAAVATPSAPVQNYTPPNQTQQVCFAEGTLTVMVGFTMKAIETIEIGDHVLAKDDTNPDGPLKECVQGRSKHH